MNTFHIVLIMVVYLIIIIYLVFRRSKSKVLKPKQLQFLHKRLKIMLRTFIQLLERNNYPYFIQGGTLLGCIRDGDIIEHDDDIDLGMMDEHLQHMLNNTSFIEECKSNNIKITQSKLTRTCKIKYIKNVNKNDKSKIFIDLFSYSKFNKKDNQTIIHYSNIISRKKWPKGWFNIDELFPLKYAYLDNILVSIPNYSIPYLKRHYGDSWLVPKKTHSHAHLININDNCYGECFIFK